MTADFLKDALFLGILFFCVWRTLRVDLKIMKMQEDLEHQIDLLRVYKADKE